MTPLVEINRNALANMVSRLRLLQKPAEFFSHYGGGRVPTMEQKLFYVELALRELTPLHIYKNDNYEVQVFHRPPFIHLTISRRDGQPSTDWEHFQQIKNQIVGKDNEAIEIFPAQSRLVDAGHEYHLWVHTDPKFRYPVAWGQRANFSKIEALIEQAAQLAKASASESPTVNRIG